MEQPAAGQAHSEVYEGLSVSHRPAPHVARLFAFLMDVGIVAVGFYLLYFIGAVVLGAMIGTMAVTKGKGSTTAFEAVFSVFAIVIVLCALVMSSVYFIFNEYKKGTTIGKRLFGLRVVSLDGRRLTLGQVILRDLLRTIDCWMFFPGILAITLNAQRRRLGDLIAGTMVVHSKTAEEKVTFMYLGQDDYLLFKEKLAPLPVPEPHCRSYLRYAYPTMIVGKQVDATPEEMQTLKSMIAHFVPNAAAGQLQGQDLERFFAEHCHQCLKQRA